MSAYGRASPEHRRLLRTNGFIEELMKVLSGYPIASEGSTTAALSEHVP
jgi:hypothetical protein